MSGEEVYALVYASESEPFTEISMGGIFCPIELEEEPISGTIKLVIEEPETDEEVHKVKRIGEEVFFGNEPVVMHGQLLEGEHDPFALAHLKEISGTTWAIDLA